jgi:hypothetical protein
MMVRIARENEHEHDLMLSLHAKYEQTQRREPRAVVRQLDGLYLSRVETSYKEYATPVPRNGFRVKDKDARPCVNPLWQQELCQQK